MISRAGLEGWMVPARQPEVRAKVVDDIARFCNRIRRDSALGWLSPDQFEKAM